MALAVMGGLRGRARCRYPGRYPDALSVRLSPNNHRDHNHKPHEPPQPHHRTHRTRAINNTFGWRRETLLGYLLISAYIMPLDNRLLPTCRSVGRVTSGLLLSFLAFSILASACIRNAQAQVAVQLPPIAPYFPDTEHSIREDGAERFTLRHMFHHGAYLYPNLHKRKDVHNPDAQLYTTTDDGREQPIPPLYIRSEPLHMQRLKDRRPEVVDLMIRAAREEGEVWALSPSAWTVDEIPGPNMTDKSTILSLAEMAAAAYVKEPNTDGWFNISHGFCNSTDFGWEGDGLRGHIWANEKNSTIVISLKGTTVRVFDGDETSTSDKENDNLFFSCCCGQQGQLTWRKVCNCATSTYSCNNTCVTKSLRQEHRYYTAAKELYTNVTELYPNSNVWVSGHSLGGAVSSLLGMTYGLPVVTFEAPPDNLAAKRLGLPRPPNPDDPDAPRRNGYTGTYHVGHTADPIFLGTCNGITSPCSFAGYAMETACHTGKECVYDVVGDEGRRVALTSHSIRTVIDDVLMHYDKVPQCLATPECVDCPLWKFYESNSSEITTSSTTSRSMTRTRTETCKTPGWWGCLDESTTTTATATSTSERTTTTTSTCKTPGWFGCYDKTATTTHTKVHTTATAPTATKTHSTTCHSPGFFGGCNDPTTDNSATPEPTTTCVKPGWLGCNEISTITPTRQPPITSPPATPTTIPKPTETSSITCHSKEWFGLICVDPSPDGKHRPTDPTRVPKTPESKKTCVERGFLGIGCRKWEQHGWEFVDADEL